MVQKPQKKTPIIYYLYPHRESPPVVQRHRTILCINTLQGIKQTTSATCSIEFPRGKSSRTMGARILSLLLFLFLLLSSAAPSAHAARRLTVFLPPPKLSILPPIPFLPPKPSLLPPIPFLTPATPSLLPPVSWIPGIPATP